MDEGAIILTVECPERGGTVVRHVREVQLTPEKMRLYWEKLSQFPVLFNRYIANVDDFITTFVSQDSAGNLKANGLIWEVDDVGILWITDIYPAYQALMHFTFWDRRLYGREPLVREMFKYTFKEFGFHRLVAEVPVYTWKVNHFAKKVGLTGEGRLREAVMYKGQWFDVILYSILRREALENGAQIRS